MIDKIDRPEAPQAYQITRAKDAKESQHQQSRQREEQEMRREKELSDKQWIKFDRKTTTIKPMRARRGEVLRCVFRSVSLHSGMGILQTDIIWKDGRTTKGALVLLATLEEFVQLKKMSAGQDVPENFWSRGGTIDFGIIEVIAQGTPLPGKGPDRASPPAAAGQKKAGILSSLGILDHGGRRINWGIVALYVFLLTIVVLAIVLEMRLWERT